MPRPTAAEQAAGRTHHTAPPAKQMQHERGASANPVQRVSATHRQPEIAAIPHAERFTGSGVVRANPAKGSSEYNAENKSAKTNAYAKQNAPKHQRKPDEGRPPPRH